MMTAVFINSPFDKEMRFECKEFKTNNSKYGEVVVLPKHRNSIFTIDAGSSVEIKDNNDKKVNLVVNEKSVVKIDGDKILVFGEYKVVNG